MITQTTTTRQGRTSWKTGEAETITESWTQIEGTVTEVVEHRPYERSSQVDLVHHIDAGEATITLTISGGNARTADGTERGRPIVGEQVHILAEPTREGSPAAALAQYKTQGSRVTVL